MLSQLIANRIHLILMQIFAADLHSNQIKWPGYRAAFSGLPVASQTKLVSLHVDLKESLIKRFETLEKNIEIRASWTPFGLRGTRKFESSENRNSLTSAVT